MLISVQYGRAIAAALVVWAHLAGFSLFTPLGIPEFGGFGVDIFFVISGFIMWETASSQSPREFAVRRLSRVVPVYWFYTTLIVALSLIAPNLTPRVHPDFLEVLCSFLFIPHANARGEVNPVLLQGWTLNYEMYFYLIFGIALALKSLRLRFAIVAAFFVASSAIGLLAPPTTDILQAYTGTVLIEFVCGMAVSIAAVHSTRRSRALYTCLCALGAMMLGVGEHLSPDANQRLLVYGVPAAVLLYGAIGLESTLRRRPWKAAVALGNASYSLYLAHPFVLSAIAILVKLAAVRVPMSPIISAVTFVSISATACFVVALLSHRWLELPLGRLANSVLRLKRRPEQLPTAAEQGSP